MQSNTAAPRSLADFQRFSAGNMILNPRDGSAITVASLHAREQKSDAQLFGTSYFILQNRNRKFEIRDHIAPRMHHVILFGSLEIQCWLVVCFNDWEHALARNGRRRRSAFFLCSPAVCHSIVSKTFHSLFPPSPLVTPTCCMSRTATFTRGFNSASRSSSRLFREPVPLIIFCSFPCRAHGSLRHGDDFSFVREKAGQFLAGVFV